MRQTTREPQRENSDPFIINFGTFDLYIPFFIVIFVGTFKMINWYNNQNSTLAFTTFPNATNLLSIGSLKWMRIMCIHSIFDIDVHVKAFVSVIGMQGTKRGPMSENPNDQK